MEYYSKKELKTNFDDSVERVISELSKEGFGIISRIDVKETMNKKLGVDYEKYLILGACNPKFAHGALELEKEIGLLLPCNVIVYEEDGRVFVAVINTIKALSIVDNKELKVFAQQVEKRLKRVLFNL